MSSTSATLQRSQPTAPALREMISALSFALDLTEGAVPGHAIRACLLAMRLAAALSLPSRLASPLYYAALLKDVGCSSNAARLCQIVGGDERQVKAGVKLVDWTRPFRPDPPALRLLWRQVLPGRNALHKAARIARVAATQHRNNRILIDLRCDRGAYIVRKIGLDEQVAVAVRHLDEHWDGSGYPDRLQHSAIPLLARILTVAQHLDVFCMEQGPKAAIGVLEDRNRRWFDPEIVRAALALHRGGALWTHCLPGESSAAAHAAVLDHEPGPQPVPAPADLDLICEAFSDVVDAKSPFTYRHSLGVKHAAIAIGRAMGLPPERLQTLRRAALLHDLGKLGVSNSILDKPGDLTPQEFLQVRNHPTLGKDILYRIAAFREVAILAGEHHEKLDGSGYPDGLRKHDLSLESRILALADVFGALSEDRPYRERLSLAQVSAILEKDVPGKLDPDCYGALQDALRLGLHDEWRTRPAAFEPRRRGFPQPISWQTADAVYL